MINEELELEKKWTNIPNEIRTDLKILSKIVSCKKIDMKLYESYVYKIYNYDKNLTIFDIPNSEMPK